MAERLDLLNTLNDAEKTLSDLGVKITINRGRLMISVFGVTVKIIDIDEEGTAVNLFPRRSPENEVFVLVEDIPGRDTENTTTLTDEQLEKYVSVWLKPLTCSQSIYISGEPVNILSPKNIDGANR